MSDFQISTIELLCLKKLELISQALATKLSFSAAREQKCLADTLKDVVTRYEIAASSRQESPFERRQKIAQETLHKLIYDLSDALTDEGPDWSQDGLDSLRRRVVNALPPSMTEGWLDQYREAPMVRS